MRAMRAHALTLLAALLAAASSAAFAASAAGAIPTASIKESGRPWFCHDLDCPKYAVRETISADIELRCYEPSVWASTTLQDVSYDSSVRQGFWRLFKYIQGDNLPQKKIAMTAPVRTLVYPGDGPFCTDNFTVSFMVPFAEQDEPPEPVRKDVAIERDEAACYWVASFGGWPSEKKYRGRADDMISALTNQGRAEQFDASHYYTASYDPPFRLMDRHNELWLPAKVEAKAQIKADGF